MVRQTQEPTHLLGVIADHADRAATEARRLCRRDGISGKWLELLKQIVPGVTRAEVLRDPAVASGTCLRPSKVHPEWIR
jgi:hypothetical protein